MSGDVNDILGITPKPDAKPAPPDALALLLAESKKQTRHLQAIRWMLAFAWLMLLIGGIRFVVR
jgi:hypothetical protein